jgi:uncharacterized protein
MTTGSKTTTTSGTGSRGAPGRRPRPAPQRTCVGCRRTGNQPTFVRLVSRPDGVIVDDGRRRAPGRGAYLCRNAACWDRALRGALAHALRTTIDESNRQALLAYGARFTPSAEDGSTGAATAEAAGSDDTAPRTARTAEKERDE